MNRFRIEQAVVLVAGFLLGAAVALCLSPGNLLLGGLVGVLVSVYCREYFVRNCRGEIFGWSHARRRHLRRHGPRRPPVEHQADGP
jgi:hypothetical protein